MINYGYFRHRFDAHENSKLNSFIDDVGFVGYAYYFSILELYGARFSARENETNTVHIHQRVISNTWRKRVDSCHLVLTKLQLSGMLVFTKMENTYSIDIPNFAKYYGSYKKTNRVNVANKSKVKESKVKKSKEKSVYSRDDLDSMSEIINHLNSVTGKSYKSKSEKTKSLIKARMREDYSIDDFKRVIDIKNAEWSDDDKMNKFIRPETLFSNKFESYLNQPSEGGFTSFTKQKEIELEKQKIMKELGL